MTDINQLKSNPEVLQLYHQYLPGLKRDGKNFTAKCIFHEGDNQPSLKINEVDGLWLWKCFGCGAGGSIIDFIQKIENCTIKKAIDIVEKFAGKAFETKKKEVEQIFKPIGNNKKVNFLTMPLESFQKFEVALRASNSALEYLQGRGIAIETAQRMHLGFRQDIGLLAGNENQDIAVKGWLMFPYLENGQVVFIKYRSLVRKVFVAQPGMHTTLYNLEN